MSKWLIVSINKQASRLVKRLLKWFLTSDNKVDWRRFYLSLASLQLIYALELI